MGTKQFLPRHPPHCKNGNMCTNWCIQHMQILMAGLDRLPSLKMSTKHTASSQTRGTRVWMAVNGRQMETNSLLHTYLHIYIYICMCYIYVSIYIYMHGPYIFLCMYLYIYILLVLACDGVLKGFAQATRFASISMSRRGNEEAPLSQAEQPTQGEAPRGSGPSGVFRPEVRRFDRVVFGGRCGFWWFLVFLGWFDRVF